MFNDDTTDLFKELENNLLKNSNISNVENIKIAVDKISEATKIFDKYGLHTISDVLLDLLANMK